MRLLVAAVAALLLMPAAATADRTDCWPRKSSTVKRDKGARVYTVGNRTFGCLYRVGRRVRLDPGYESAFAPWRLAGRYAAYESEWEPPDAVVYRPPEVRVANLATGRIRSAVAWSGDLDNAPHEPPDAEIASLVLHANGSAAWMSWDADRQVGSELWTLTRAGATKIDGGEGVDPRSLRLTGRRITWRKAGETRSAELR